MGSAATAFHRAGFAPEISADDAHVGAVVVGDLGNVGGLHFLIARRRHLERGRKIRPQLEAVHAAGRIALGHFLMNDAAARGHPLHVAGGDGAVVAHAVAVLDGSGEHVGDGLDAAMRMPGKSGEIVLGDVIAKIVEQEERIEVVGVAEAEGAAQMHAGAFERGLGLDQALYGTNGHDGLWDRVSRGSRARWHTAPRLPRRDVDAPVSLPDAFIAGLRRAGLPCRVVGATPEAVGQALVFERDDSAAVTAEGGDSLQVAVGAGYSHDGAVAIDGVAGGGKVPASALDVLGERRGRLPRGFGQGYLGNRQTEQQG